MAGGFSLEWNGQTFTDAGAGLSAFGRDLEQRWDGSVKAVSQELSRMLADISAQLIAMHGRSWPDGTTQSSLSSRSGALVEAIRTGFSVSGTTLNTLVGRFTLPPPYEIHETGGTMRARGGNFMAIPLPAALDGKGLPLKASPRDWEDTFCAMSRNGNLLIFQKRGTTIVPLYVLKTSVTLPARLRVNDTFQTNLPRFLDRMVDRIAAAMTDKP